MFTTATAGRPVSNMHLGLFRADVDGTLVHVDASALALVGRTLEELRTPDVWVDLVPPERRQEILASWNDFIQRRLYSLRLDYEMIVADGSRRPVIIDIVAEIDDQACITGYTGILTNPGATEKQLATMMHRRELVASLAPVGIYLVDTEQTPGVWVNERWCEITGLDRETAAAEGAMGLVHPDDRMRLQDVVGEAYRSGGVFEIEHRIIRRDGALLWLLVQGTVELNDDGTPRAFIAIVSDVTPLKRAEERIRQLNAELEQRVADRTRELEISNRELEAFCYSVSHDLRSPLRIIDGFSLMVLEEHREELSDAAREALLRVRRASRRMGSLIDQLLGLSRLTLSDIHAVTVDLAELARDHAAELAAIQPDRDVVFDIAASLVVQGDAALLASVMRNLLDNAWKFTGPRTSARIEVGELGEPAGQRVFFVRDNGVGFDPAFNHKLFRTFERLHNEHEFEGTGVGLATVARIVQRHGGKVWAESKPQAGATFYFTLAN